MHSRKKVKAQATPIREGGKKKKTLPSIPFPPSLSSFAQRPTKSLVPSLCLWPRLLARRCWPPANWCLLLLRTPPLGPTPTLTTRRHWPGLFPPVQSFCRLLALLLFSPSHSLPPFTSLLTYKKIFFLAFHSRAKENFSLLLQPLDFAVSTRSFDEPARDLGQLKTKPSRSG